ncbi:protein LAZY 1-like [Mangifera indica]|uniref:protein LAZY 1-like n=1 Tax=Mangifera indica TaxID=29780 RepID=UPI001CFA516A|nr:protein LAZY 1-like [Mangifera indica]
MKQLLGWMQHKIRQNGIDLFKDFTIGNYCTCLSAQSILDDQEHCSKPSFGSRCGSRASKQPKQDSDGSISEFEAKGVEANFDEETTSVISELFDGFLAIGTLGTEKITSGPATPTFAMSMQNITEEKAEVTEYDLKLINDELGKFLETEADEGNSNESSRRDSYVSIVILGENPMEGANDKDYGKMTVCPLQGYLFGTSVEQPETTEVKKEKASLAELFHRTKIADEISTDTKSGKVEMQAKKTHKSVKHFMKKMMKTLHAIAGNPNPSNSDANSASTNKKLHKVMRMFRRKVHPENSIVEKVFTKSHAEKINRNPQDGTFANGAVMHSDKNDKSFPLVPKSKEGTQYYMNNRKCPQYGLKGTTSSGNREHWIKTDADCKYQLYAFFFSLYITLRQLDRTQPMTSPTPFMSIDYWKTQQHDIASQSLYN